MAVVNNIQQHINQISIYLKDNRASAMVGAGYSFNAEKTHPEARDFSNWKQLGELFFEKINNREYRSEDGQIDPILLASEVYSEYGRVGVDSIILQAIPDYGYKPGELHYRLLELPWKTIFTTNYDRLLEQTTDVTSRKYSIVTNKDALPPLDNRPRIIKLHGSYTSSKPWIITKEDYENYPQNYDAFITQVKAEMTNTCFCLFGFSGDDPNFIKWIEWTQRELREYSIPMYLIGVFTKDELEKYKDRDYLKIINMGNLDDVKNHKEGLHKFFELLNKELVGKEFTEIEAEGPVKHNVKIIEDIEQENESMDVKEIIQNNVQPAHQIKDVKWSLSRIHIEGFLQDEVSRQEERLKAISAWSKDRKTYPGWFIAPKDSSDTLYYYTDNASYLLKDACDEATTANYTKILEFAYELCWRYETGLFSMSQFVQQKIAFIVKCYHPSPNIKKELDWWIYLCFVLLREYREDNMINEWNAVCKKLTSFGITLSEENALKLEYEQIMLLFSKMELVKLRQELLLWKIPSNFFVYRLKRLGLLSELGETSKAEKGIADLCKELEQLNESGDKKDIICRKSLLACALTLHAVILQGNDFLAGKFNKSSPKKKKIYEQIRELSPVYNMQEELKKLNADILNHFFENNSKRPLFDLDRESVSIIHSNGTYCREAYQYIRIFEKVNIPYQINHVSIDSKTLKRALFSISESHVHFALFTLIRSHDYKNAEEIWSRDYLCDFNQAKIDDFSKFIISSIRDNLHIIETKNRWKESNIFTSLAAVMPEILSRLCMKCSDYVKREMVLLLKEIYGVRTISNFMNIRNLLIRLMKSMSEDLKAELLPFFLEIEVPDGESAYDKHEIIEPFDLFSYNITAIPLYRNIKIESSQIDRLFIRASDSERKRVAMISRLMMLHDLGILKEDNIKKFGELIWEKINPLTGLPDLCDYYCSIYLSLPHPLSINPVSKVKKYLLSCEIKEKTDNNSGVQMDDMQGKQSVSITMGDIRYLREIIMCSKIRDNDDGLIWSKFEAEHILNQMIDWWDDDKKHLKTKKDDNHYSLTDEYRSRFKTMVEVCTTVCYSVNDELSSEVIDRLFKMISELEENDIINLSLETAIYSYKFDISYLADKIEEALYSLNSDEVVDASNAIQYLAEKRYGIIEVKELVELLSLLLRLRKQPSLNSFINVIHNIIYNECKIVSDKFYNNLFCGLDYIRLETEYKKETVICNLKKKIEIRKSAANLASIIYKEYRKNGRDIPVELNEWKIICQNKEEFAEVRNQWRLYQ